jgi:hypothetical protein
LDLGSVGYIHIIFLYVWCVYSVDVSFFFSRFYTVACCSFPIHNNITLRGTIKDIYGIVNGLLCFLVVFFFNTRYSCIYVSSMYGLVIEKEAARHERNVIHGLIFFLNWHNYICVICVLMCAAIFLALLPIFTYCHNFCF